MRTIAFGTFGPLNMANLCHMTPLPTILALKDTWVHVGSSHHCNDIFYIEPSIDDFFGIGASLSVPYVNPNYHHVGLGRNFDNIWFRSENYDIEDVVVFKNMFNILRGDMSV